MLNEEVARKARYRATCLYKEFVQACMYVHACVCARVHVCLPARHSVNVYNVGRFTPHQPVNVLGAELKNYGLTTSCIINICTVLL